MDHHHASPALMACRVLALCAACALAAAAPGHAGQPVTPGEVSLSMVTWIGPSTLAPGQSNTLCVTANLRSADAEYIDRIDLDLPDAWLVAALAADSEPPANGCTDARPLVAGVAAGNLIYWQSSGTLPTTCGAWFGGPGGSEFILCAQVTVPDCSGAPWHLPWHIAGDGLSNAPHVASGVYESLSCAAPDTPNVEVDPLSLAATQSQGASTSRTLTLTNTGSADLVWAIVTEPVAMQALAGSGLAGAAAPCTAPADVLWLSVDASGGSIGPMQYTPVTVSLNASGLAPGIHHANLCVTSNDPDAGPGNGTALVVVPVTLTVDDRIFGNGFDG